MDGIEVLRRLGAPIGRCRGCQQVFNDRQLVTPSLLSGTKLPRGSQYCVPCNHQLMLENVARIKADLERNTQLAMAQLQVNVDAERAQNAPSSREYREAVSEHEGLIRMATASWKMGSKL